MFVFYSLAICALVLEIFFFFFCNINFQESEAAISAGQLSDIFEMKQM